MATYIHGVTDYIPQVQPWAPNFNFYQSMMERKQSKYDQGWQQANSIYNSVLNAPMLRDENINRRDDFFKQVEGQIQQMGSVDLSLGQNQIAAAEIFKPFYEDENIIKDIGFTKQYQDEMQHAEYLRKCTDPKTCGGKYWEGGVRALNYQAQDFVDASSEDALRMRAPKYTNYVNAMQKYGDAVQAAGFSMKVDHKSGGYIVTEKNGAQLQIPLTNFLMDRFGDDPELKEFYGTKAYLLTKENPEMANRLYQEAMKNPRASQEELKAQTNSNLLSETYDNSRAVIQGAQEKEENRFKTLVKRKRVLENDIKRRGAIPGSENANGFNQLVKDQGVQANVVSQLNGMNDEVSNTDAGLRSTGLVGNETQMRSVIASAMQIQDTYSAATSLAYRDYERTMKADPFAIEATRHGNSVALAQMKNRFTQQNKALDYIFDKDIAALKKNTANGNLDIYGNSHYMRPNSSIWDLANGGGANAGDQNEADLLAMTLLGGMSDPYSGTTVHGRAIEQLLTQGRIPEAMQLAQLSSRPKKETPVEDPDISTTVTTAPEGANILKKALSNFKKGQAHDKQSIKKMTGALDTAASRLKEQLGSYNEQASEIESKLNSDALTIMMNKAADAGDIQNEDAQIELLSLGNLISDNFYKIGKQHGKYYNKNYSDYKALADKNWGNTPKLTEEEWKIVTSMPTDQNLHNNDNAEYYRKLSNIGIEKITALAGGDKNLYDFFEGGQGVWVKDQKTGEYIDKNAAGLISANERSKWGNMIQDELTAQNEDPTYKNSKITEDMRKAVTQYDRLNEGHTFERHYGSGTDIEALKLYNADPGIAAVRTYRDMYRTASDLATKIWNDGLKTSVDEAAASSLMTSGNTPGDKLQDAIVKKLFIDRGEGKLASLPKPYELNNLIAESIPELMSDPSMMNVDFSSNEWASKWEDTLKDFTKNVMGGPVSKKSMLNLLSVSNYMTIAGADKPYIFTGYDKVDIESHAQDYNKAIAGHKYYLDQQKPQEERQYSDFNQALQATMSENPYAKTRKEPTMVMQANIMGSTDEGGKDKYAKGGQSQKYMQWLGANADAVSETYSGDGNHYAISPNFEYYNMYAPQKIKSGSKMSFDLSIGQVEEGFQNLFTEHQAEIGRGYEKVLSNFTNKPSSVGGLFTNASGQSIGQGTMTSTGLILHDVDASVKAGQNYFDAVSTLETTVDAINNNEFIIGSDTPPAVSEVLTRLRNQMDDPFSKGHAPQFDLKIQPMAGTSGASQYTLTFTDDTWLKDQGYNKWDGKTQQFSANPMDMSFSWAVKNPTDNVSELAVPTMFSTILGNLSTGESYTNRALEKDFGSVYYTKTGDGTFVPGMEIKLFNPATGKEDLTRIPGDEQSFYSNDMVGVHNTMLQQMISTKQLSDQTRDNYAALMGTMDPTELLNWYSQQVGVSPETFTQK